MQISQGMELFSGFRRDGGIIIKRNNFFSNMTKLWFYLCNEACNVVIVHALSDDRSAQRKRRPLCKHSWDINVANKSVCYADTKPLDNQRNVGLVRCGLIAMKRLFTKHSKSLTMVRCEDKNYIRWYDVKKQCQALVAFAHRSAVSAISSVRIRIAPVTMYISPGQFGGKVRPRFHPIFMETKGVNKEEVGTFLVSRAKPFACPLNRLIMAVFNFTQRDIRTLQLSVFSLFPRIKTLLHVPFSRNLGTADKGNGMVFLRFEFFCYRGKRQMQFLIAGLNTMMGREQSSQHTTVTGACPCCGGMRIRVNHRILFRPGIRPGHMLRREMVSA